MNLPPFTNKFPCRPSVAIDFETTGRKISTFTGKLLPTNGSIIGLGISVGFENENGSVFWSGSAAVKPAFINPDTMPSTEADLKNLWERQQWDDAMRVEFWVKYIPQLRMLWTPSDTHMVYDTLEELAQWLNAVLLVIEQCCPDGGGYQWITDCGQFEPWLANSLLIQNGYEPMTHLRTGMYRWAGFVDEDSLMRCMGAGWHELLKKFKAEAEQLVALPPHHPQHDAFVLLYRVIKLFRAAPLIA